jgi:hypothetical protein
VNELENQLFSALARTHKKVGRKPTGSKKILMNFGFDPEIVTELRTKIPPYKRTRFVQAAIKTALNSH